MNGATKAAPLPTRLLVAVALLLTLARPAAAACLAVPDADPAIKITAANLDAMAKAKLREADLYRVMKVVSRYETDGCWAGATGSFDGQWLSVGVKQWNFGTGSLQPILARYKAKFATEAEFQHEINRLMPKYGKDLFDPSCRAKPIGSKCKYFLQARYLGDRKQLAPDLKGEIDALFESEVMRQLQVDYFARDLTRVVDDLDRVFQSSEPEAWQVAWAMDLKTQQGRFPGDASIRRVRQTIDAASPAMRASNLSGIVTWYRAECQTGFAEGVNLDWQYNVDTWDRAIQQRSLTRNREEAVHFTFLVSHTARTDDGTYQADTFQRRASIAFGKGSVHGRRVDFLN